MAKEAVISCPQGIPTWDSQQLEIIHDDPAAWQLVVAGAGCGKSAVACQRVAHLVDEGVPASRVLLISFTRTAVAELRDRILQSQVKGIRRIHLPATRHHIYYLTGANVVVVLAVWGSVKESGPDLRGVR